MLATKLLSAMAGGGETLYVDDVFSAYTYTGNSSAQAITNGIDLAGRGGMVWVKNRGSTSSHQIWDSVRGGANFLHSELTNAQNNVGGTPYTLNSNGYTLNSETTINQSSQNFVSWTFRKAPKFFDVVTYTGNGDASRVLSHAIGGSVGTIIIKKTSTVSRWMTWHRSLTANHILYMNTTAASVADGFNPSPTDTTFTVQASVGDGCNASGVTYVAYLFAHDTGTDGLIQCGSFTTDGGGAGPFVDLGWEPQFVLYKDANYVTGAGGDWNIVDSSRGMRGYAGLLGDPMLEANTTAAEQQSAGYANATATGFYGGGTASHTYIYMAIRRPNKPPTVGTQVYNAIARTGTGTNSLVVSGVGFAPDLVLPFFKAGSVQKYWFDRLRGNKWLFSSATSAEGSGTSSDGIVEYQMNGYKQGSNESTWFNQNAYTYIDYFFKRAPGVFDVVCYTGTGSWQYISHGLGVIPELIIIKKRNSAGNWVVMNPTVGWNYTAYLNSTAAFTNILPAPFAGESTATNFQVYTPSDVNQSAATFVAYLFATKTGVSKVFNYTGNGSSQTINCGFTTGARFILIKRTNATGDWFVWDTARGIIAGNDPHLSLNTTVAEVTTDDSIDPNTSGFIVNQVTATNINVNLATYVGLAFA